MFWNLPKFDEDAEFWPTYKKGGKQEISNYRPI
jgi:hypothetical protein